MAGLVEKQVLPLLNVQSHGVGPLVQCTRHTILPIPFAFAKTGIATGFLTMLLVAIVNDTTCCMLIRAAAYTGRDSFESLAEWAGGKRAKVITQFSLILLLYGTLCGSLAFLSDVARVMVQKGLPDAPDLIRNDGRLVMLAVVALVLYPLCLQRHIRQFEKAATVGVLVVVALSALIITKAIMLGFPAVKSGELPVFSIVVDTHLPEAFAVIGFAFYMQPMLMPLLREMPPPPDGQLVSERAVHTVLYGVACFAYGTVGIFGAAIFGQSTESNIMVNQLLTNQWAILALYFALLIYLCCGMVTGQFALRASVDALLFGADASFTWARHVAETTIILSCALLVALLFPTYAEKIFAVTGCTADALAPLLADQEDGTHEHPHHTALLGWPPPAGPATDPPVLLSRAQLVPCCSYREHTLQHLISNPRELLLPALVVAVGVGCSVAGLWVAIRDLYSWYHPSEGLGLMSTLEVSALQMLG